MARRSDHTREELKDLAIQAAIALIETDGIGQFSARQVAARIGYTVGTLYNVFGSYDELLLNVNARTLDDWYEFLQSRLARRGRSDPLRVLARGYIDYARTKYNRWIALFEYRHSEAAGFPDWYEQKLKRLFAMVEEIILPQTSQDRKKAKRAAQVLWAGIHGICVLSLSDRLELAGPDSPEALAFSLIDNYMKGFKNE
jgi:AcrR family transcriptional regulator